MKKLTNERVSLHTLATVLISMCFLAFQIYVVIRGTLPYIVAVPVHMCFGLSLTYLYFPIDKKNEKLKCLKFIDFIIQLLILFILVYYVSQGERLESRMPFLSPVTTLDKVILSFFWRQYAVHWALSSWVLLSSA